jgi:hypothetical protein
MPQLSHMESRIEMIWLINNTPHPATDTPCPLDLGDSLDLMELADCIAAELTNHYSEQEPTA